MTHIIFSTNLTMSPQIDDFLKKPPLLNLSSYCSGSVSVTIRIIKQKTQSDKPVGLTWLWSSVCTDATLVRSPITFQGKPDLNFPTLLQQFHIILQFDLS